jgi:hypothetical protein
MELKASGMLGKHCITELHPQALPIFIERLLCASTVCSTRDRRASETKNLALRGTGILVGGEAGNKTRRMEGEPAIRGSHLQSQLLRRQR